MYTHQRKSIDLNGTWKFYWSRKPADRPEDFDSVERLAERVAPLGLGTDVIVGFPGETDEDHRRTTKLISALPFTYVHVFPYSERRGTDAEGLPDAVPPQVLQ